MAAFAVIVTVLFWGSAFTGIAIALEAFAPGPLALLRFGTATLTLLAVAAVRRVSWPPRAALPRLVAISLVGITAYHLMLNFGQQWVPPGTTAILIQTAPVFTALLASRFDGADVSRRAWAGIGIALLGTVVLVLGRGGDLAFTGGAALIIGCAVATSVYFVFQRPLVAAHGVQAVTTWSIAIGTLPMLVFAPGAVQQWSACGELAPKIAVIYVGIFPAALAYLAWNEAVRRLTAARAMVFLYLVPLVTIATSWLWDGSLPTATSLLGGGIAMGGVVLVNTERRRRG